MVQGNVWTQGKGVVDVLKAAALTNEGARWLPPPDLPADWRKTLSVGDAQLECWDTGGDGPAVIMLHPVTGKAEVFAFQLHALAAAGYRAIAYSRRGYEGSSEGSTEPGIATQDLRGVMDVLDVGSAALLAAGGGAGAALDFTRSYPARVTALILVCTLCGMSEPGSKGGAGALIPKQFRDLPIAFKELGPAFRWASPDGVAHWELASPAKRPPHPAPLKDITPATLNAIKQQVLMVGGDADLYVPPPRLHALAAEFSQCEAHVLRECGHAAHWEKPDEFNAVMLEFLSRVLD